MKRFLIATAVVSLWAIAWSLASLRAEAGVAGKLLKEWRAPIEFYGKVVDENSNPVAGAQITFRWMEVPDNSGSRSSKTVSDAKGMFSLHGAKGPSVSVWFSKDGYYSSHHGQRVFNYALGPDPISPDPLNPEIFVLHKKGQGASLITSQNGMRADVSVRVPPDNTPVTVDLLKKQASPNGPLSISQIKPPFREATNWSFRLSIPNGGLVENHDEFQYRAPESNYQTTLEFDFDKSGTNWATQVTKQFYIEFGEPRKYGWLKIESNLQQETVFLTYAINPSGSRNLEPAK